jgi:hypothetical protein
LVVGPVGLVSFVRPAFVSAWRVFADLPAAGSRADGSFFFRVLSFIKTPKRLPVNNPNNESLTYEVRPPMSRHSRRGAAEKFRPTNNLRSTREPTLQIEVIQVNI